MAGDRFDPGDRVLVEVHPGVTGAHGHTGGAGPIGAGLVVLDLRRHTATRSDRATLRG